MAEDYTFDEDTLRLRIDCLGYMYGASLEDYEECMSRVMDTLLEVKKASSIVLAKEREYEYDQKQARMLLELAGVLEKIIREKLIYSKDLRTQHCIKFYKPWTTKLQHIVLDLMRKDPIGAYVEILREMRHIKVRAESVRYKNYTSCLKEYFRILDEIKSLLEDTRLIKMVKPYLAGYHIGDRTFYRQIFMPSIRPNFMFTRFIITPPKNGKSVDMYKVGDSIVEIFELPDSAEYFYHILPPEFTLSEEKYTILDTARKYMATHKPTSAKFVKSTNMREIFYNIGKDMIRETATRMGYNVKDDTINQLATILTRYTAGLGVLEVLLSDEKVQDVYINSPIEKHPILINHSDWEECKTNLIPTMEDAEAWATRLRIESGRPLDEANPVLDVDLSVPGGKARFAAITRTLSPQGLGFAIRRHRDKPWTLPLFIKQGMITSLAAGLFSFLIDGSVSMLVAGGRGAGKTSFLGALMLELLPKTRVVTIEDTLELPVDALRQLKYNVESLKSRSVITRVETEMPADEALRTALRLGDSALIVGEVRSVEAKALYEAMRVGALSNVVAGTIHGESAYGVYDRVVNDLGVPPTSFKATDIVMICKSLRSADGLHKFRRMTEVTEIRKRWNEDPMKEGGFINLMEYSGKLDKLKPTDVFVHGESEVLNRIASHVREWSGDWESVWGNILLRGKIKEKMIELSDTLRNPDILEAPWVVRSNSRLHSIQESIKQEIGHSDPDRIYDEWLRWFKDSVNGLKPKV